MRPDRSSGRPEWSAETITTTGYGADAHWNSPLTELPVIAGQFIGVFLVFPIYVLPFFEERFEEKLRNDLPAMGDKKCVLIDRYGPDVAMLGAGLLGMWLG